MHADDEYPDGNLGFYQERIAKNEQDMVDAIMEIEFSQALAELHEHPSWKKLTDRIRTIEQGELNKLRSQPMDLYNLGKRQGRLSAFLTLLNPVPLDTSALDEVKQRITFARNQIEADRRLVEN